MLQLPPVTHSVQPAGAPGDYITFAIKSRPDVRIIVACQAAGCDRWRRGWDLAADESTDLGRAQAAYVRSGESGRTYREMRSGGLTVFRFEPHQRCFGEHHTLSERYLRRGGDWRGNPRREVRVHARAADWVEDFALHEQARADAISRG